MSTKRLQKKKAAMQAKKEKQLKKNTSAAPVPVLPNLLKMLKPK